MKSKQIIILLVVVVILLSITVFFQKEQTENPLISIPADLSNHPIYSKYKFDKAENIIYIGSQPLLSPTGHISETMKRDTILRNALMKLGIEIQFYPFLKGDDINFFLNNDKIDIGFVGDMPAITAAASSDVIIPSVVQNGFVSIIANRPMMVKELRGKRIGYASGSNAHYALLSALSFSGLTEADVKLIPMEITDMPESLHNGNISAFSAWEPASTIALKKHPDNTAIHRHLSTGYLYFSKDLWEKHPEAVYQIVAAEIRAIRWMQNRSQNLLKASKWVFEVVKSQLNQVIELSEEQHAAIALEDIIGDSWAPVIPKIDLLKNGPLHREFKFLKTLGKISPSAQWAKVRDSFDREIIIEVLKHSQKYSLDTFQ